MATDGKKKPTQPARSNNEIRTIMLQYFYDRNKLATSARVGECGSIEVTANPALGQASRAMAPERKTV